MRNHLAMLRHSKQLHAAFLFAVSATFSAMPASAAENLITNGSFESGANPGVGTELVAGASELSGWTIQTGNIDYIGSRWTAYEGVRCIDLSGSVAGSISQKINGLIVGQRYTLAFQMAVNPEAPPASTELEVSLGGTTRGFSATTVGTITDLRWSEQSIEFTATSQSTDLVLKSGNPGWAGPVLDAIRLEAQPEATPQIINGSFELGINPGISTQINSGDSTSLLGWKVQSGNIDYIGSRWMAADGARCIDLSGAVGGSIAQAVTGLRIGARYQFGFKMAVNPEAPPASTELLVVFGSVSNRFSMTTPGTTANLGWRDHQLEFVATSSTAELTLISLNSGWAGPALDQLSLRSVASPPPPAVVYDVSQDFSTVANPNGAWQFGWQPSLGGPLSPLTFGKPFGADNGVPIFSWQLSDSAGPGVCKVIGPGTANSAGGQFVAPAGTVYMAPGNNGAPQNFGTVRFTVPSGASGEYRIETAVRDVFDGSFQGDTDFHVLRNGTELFGQFLPPHSVAGYTNTLSLISGDTIDFVLGRGQDNNGAGSLLKLVARISSNVVPPPPPPPPVATVFDVSTDYSTAINPGSAWRYGWKSSLEGAFSLITFNKSFGADNGVPIHCWQLSDSAGPSICKVIGPGTASSAGGQFTAAPGTVYFAAGRTGAPENFGVIRFTVPAGGAGTYRLETDVRDVFDGSFQGDTDFHVLKNDAPIFGQNLAPHTTAGFTNAVTVSDGDTIDFVIGRGADARQEGSLLKIKATLSRSDSPKSLVLNGSFEDGINPGVSTQLDAVDSTSLTAWTVQTGNIDYIGTRWTAADGNRCIDLSGAVGGSISQDLEGLTANQPYRLSFKMAVNPEAPPPSTELLVVIAGTTNRFSMTQPGTTTQLGWTEQTVTFVAKGDVSRLTFVSLNPGWAGPVLDNISLVPDESVDPEPTIVKNGSFEIGANPGVSANLRAVDSTTIRDWTIESGSIDYIGTRWSAGDGARSIDLSGEGPGRISQSLNALQPGQRYRLSFLMAGNPELLPMLGNIKSLRASIDTVSTEFSFDTEGKSSLNMGWTLKTMDFTASSSSVKLSFESLVNNIGGPALDGVSVSPIMSPTNSAPVAIAVSVETTEDTPVSIVLAATDPDGDPLTFKITQPPHGSLAGNPPTLTYTPRPDFSGHDQFTFTVSDGVFESQSATVSIQIRPSQDKPVAVAVIGCVATLDDESSWIAIAGTSTNAAVVLDATGSFDIDSDPLSYLWFADGNLQPVANSHLATNLFELGQHVITLVVDDGFETDSATLELEVVTLHEALNLLCLSIDKSKLETGRKRPLIASCEAAQQSLRKGNLTAAANQLNALIEKLKNHELQEVGSLVEKWVKFARCITEAIPEKR